MKVVPIRLIIKASHNVILVNLLVSYVNLKHFASRVLRVIFSTNHALSIAQANTIKIFRIINVIFVKVIAKLAFLFQIVRLAS